MSPNPQSQKNQPDTRAHSEKPFNPAHENKQQPKAHQFRPEEEDDTEEMDDASCSGKDHSAKKGGSKH